MSKKTDNLDDKHSDLKNSNQPSFKTGNTKREGEGSLYDKIMRENLLEIFLPLLEEELNFKLKSVQPLPDKQPTTVIRETDAFLLVETYSEEKFILHIEFESSDDEEMIYRVMEHHGIELRKYRLPIKHVVVYLGTTSPKMRTKLKPTEVFEGFVLVNAYNFSPKKWLEKDEPSKIIMAVLGDYRKENAEIILEAIISKLRKVCKTETELKKFVEQLIIISRMRNLEELTIKISKAMPILIDIEKDYLYKLGLKQADVLVKKAKEVASKAKKQVEQLTKEKAELEAIAKAETKKAQKEAERAKIEAQKEAERAKMEAQKEAERAKIEAQKATERAKMEAERAKMEAQKEAERAKIAEKKISIQKMKANNKLSNKEIMEFLNLDEPTFNKYLKEIAKENQKTKSLDKAESKNKK